MATQTDLEKATKALASAKSAVARAEAAIADAQVAAALRSRPEPSPDGAIIFFEKRYRGGSRGYSFAARKAGGLWYLTGTEGCSPRSWRSLLEFADEGSERPVTIHVVTASESVGTRASGA